jgi:hypothetical protein
MKMILITSFALFWSVAALDGGQANLPLTNNVPVVDYGMNLALCDNFGESHNEYDMLNEKELKADKDLTWILHNTTSNNWNSVIFLGMTNSFDFRLFNQDGLEIPKTIKGKAMSAGPKSLSQITANPFVRRVGSSFSDFPKLTELFNFPSNGIYTFELRFWGWAYQKKQFLLSQPVRLRVVKQGPEAAQKGNPKNSP